MGHPQAVPAEVRRDRQRASAGPLRRLLQEVPRRHQGQVSADDRHHEHVLERPEPRRHRAGRRRQHRHRRRALLPRRSGWIRTNFDYFDKYPRKPWKVYVGEYAHHHGSGDWSAAMDDSVYLMMLERNGDLVTMASYAPLFCNVNQRDWGVNLIEFDSSRSFAHASYYVQKVFNENRPDVNLATDRGRAAQARPEPTAAGRPVRPRRVEHAERVQGTPHLRRAGQAGLQRRLHSRWTTGTRRASASGRRRTALLQQTDLGQVARHAVPERAELQTGRVTLKARRVGGNEGFLMFFNASGPDRFMFCNYGAAGNQFSAIQGTSRRGLRHQGRRRHSRARSRTTAGTTSAWC